MTLEGIGTSGKCELGMFLLGEGPLITEEAGRLLDFHCRARRRNFMPKGCGLMLPLSQFVAFAAPSHLPWFRAFT